MSSATPAASIGIDFGTSNTVVAIATPDGAVESLRFEHGGIAHGVYASALCFWQDRPGSAVPAKVEGGPWAIERMLEESHSLRYIQSFKTFAASESFQQTTIFREKMRFEDLLATFLRTLMRHAGHQLDLKGARIAIGRPVRFAGANPNEPLAIERYQAGLGQVGITDPRYVYEPVGAAFSFARTLTRDATVLVADFGGGTSDFSVMRFWRHAGVLKAEPLGHSGLGVAGDTFDSRIVERVVAPRLGKGGRYRSFGKVLPLPVHYYTTLARWNELALMKGSADLRELRELARTALEPAPLEDFIALVEHDLGFALSRAVSATKVALSGTDQAEFRFKQDGIDIAAPIARTDFESWIADDLAKISGAVDQVLAKSKLGPEAIERVFLTGGTSFVPAVQNLFAARFGAEKLASADQFESIAKGLALIGQTEHPERWAVAA
ncbi:MAG: Hsp70 family protein [Beijerinckiaceae bacterium]|nr:Hsp70 family protein [Beijerinckiaceae bacterium]